MTEALSYIYDDMKVTYQNFLNRNYKSDKDMRIEAYENAIILPIRRYASPFPFYEGGVVDKDNNFVELSGRHRNKEHKKIAGTMVGAYDFDKKDIVDIDCKAMYFEIFIYHWGHFLLECTSRLWHFVQLMKTDKEIKLAIPIYDMKPNANFKEFFELLGITDDRIIYVEKPTRFTEVVVPEAAFMLENFYTKEFISIFREITKNIESAQYKKVYMTRRHFLINDNTIGEKNIEDCFEKNGYKIIAPEKMSLKEMISIIKGAEVIAGLNGSAMHNTLFADKNTKLLILNRAGFVNSSQQIINQAGELNYTYIDVYQTFLPVSHGRGPFIVGVNDNLKQYLEDNNMTAYNYTRNVDPNNAVEFLIKYGEIYSNHVQLAYIKNYSLKDSINLIHKFFPKQSIVEQKKVEIEVEQPTECIKPKKKKKKSFWMDRVGLKKVIKKKTA